jgi:serine/threonine protein kinase
MEHDFWSLLKNNKFGPAEVKCLLKQLLEGVAYLHEQKIIHRDLKGGNLLLNNKGCLKIADFGLARRFLRETRKSQNVVTFWYRAPELLLGVRDYDEKIDIWSVGCIFAEFLTGYILFKGKKIKDQLQCIYEKLGDPLPRWKKVHQTKLWREMKPTRKYDPNLRHFISKHNKRVDEVTLDLLERLLEFNPANRISAKEALNHEYFSKHPLPCRKDQIPKFKDEFHELNSKSKPRFKTSEKLVMNDYKRIQTLDILRDLYNNHHQLQGSSGSTSQPKDVFLKSIKKVPHFSPHHSRDQDIRRNTFAGNEYLPKPEKTSEKHQDSPNFSEAFFSDDDKAPGNNKESSDKESSKGHESTEKVASTQQGPRNIIKNEDLNLDWIN